MHDLNTSKNGRWQRERESRLVSALRSDVEERGKAWLVFKITFPLKTFTSSVSLLLLRLVIGKRLRAAAAAAALENHSTAAAASVTR